MNRDESDHNRSSGELTASSFEEAEEDEWVQEERPPFSAFVLPLMLFALTLFTVLWMEQRACGRSNRRPNTRIRPSRIRSTLGKVKQICSYDRPTRFVRPMSC